MVILTVDFVITDFVSAMLVQDKRGKRVEYDARYATALIVTKYGRIRFSYQDKTLFLSPQNSILLPQGLPYVNECLEDAQSVVINFYTRTVPKTPLSLCAIPYETALECYETLKRLSLFSDLQSRCRMLEQIYALAAQMLAGVQATQSTSNLCVEKALLYLNMYYENPKLSMADVARECHISEVYLRKLFQKELGIPPSKKLFEIRMKAASLLAKEKRPVSEIAACVGYADVFQFSRAYKRYFGYPPSQTK